MSENFFIFFRFVPVSSPTITSRDLTESSRTLFTVCVCVCMCVARGRCRQCHGRRRAYTRQTAGKNCLFFTENGSPGTTPKRYIRQRNFQELFHPPVQLTTRNVDRLRPRGALSSLVLLLQVRTATTCPRPIHFEQSKPAS